MMLSDLTGKTLHKGDKVIYKGQIFTITAVSSKENVILIETDTLRLIRFPNEVNKFIEIKKPDDS